MQFAMMIFNDESQFAHTTPEQAASMTAAYAAYTQAMVQAGILLAGERLRPTVTASTVRVRENKTEVLDGPYPDTKEQFAGFYLIDVPDLDAALEWGAKCPGAAVGTIEVRPIWPKSDY